MPSADSLHRDPDGLWSQLRAALPPTGAPAGRSFACSPPAPLDEYQRSAAGHGFGPIRVLAPAGSGKTRTLTARVMTLLSNGVPAEAILALAFNARAADEMAERLADQGGQAVSARTFHSLGYEIVREAYGWRYAPENETAALDLAEELVRSALPSVEPPGRARLLRRKALDVFTHAKADLLPYAGMLLQDEDSVHPLDGIFQAFITAQAARGLLTYTDMIYFALRALVDDKHLRNRWQSRFEFILVDEFQDLNAAQMLLLRILALPQDNLFAVGDDDQLIYAWRGAREEHLLEFEASYPGAASVVLQTNYRSARRIVRHGRWLIEHNPVRVVKDIRARAGAPAGRIRICLEKHLRDQIAVVVAWIRSERQSGRGWEEFGLLARTNRDLEHLAAGLQQADIPYHLPGSTPEEDDPPRPEGKPGGVTLLTVHRAKGKEFPCVVYFNLSRRAGIARTEADERRLAYVGVTRAREALLVTADQSRPAQFLQEFALNPAFEDFTEPYLERQLALARRRASWRRGDVRAWLMTFLPSVRPNPARAAEEEGDEAAELLATELEFRAALGISFTP